MVSRAFRDGGFPGFMVSGLSDTGKLGALHFPPHGVT